MVLFQEVWAQIIEPRFVRIGPAKARPTKGTGSSKTARSIFDASSDEDHVIPSEFEENEEDLSNYLQSNSSFLVNMHATGAFSVLYLYICMFLFGSFELFDVIFQRA